MSHFHFVICAQHACIVYFQNYCTIYMFMSNLIFAGLRLNMQMPLSISHNHTLMVHKNIRIQGLLHPQHDKEHDDI